MPLLAKEPDIFPEDLFSRDDPWIVVRVRSRQEKVLARDLHGQGIGFYLPLHEVKKRSAGRIRTSYLPLFGGYVFVRASRESRAGVLRSGVVACLIDVPDQSELQNELQQVRLLQLTGASFAVCEALVPGDPVAFRSGPFEGYSGVVERWKGQERLIIRISLLQRAVAVEIDRDSVSRKR